jgi:Txe/YoeB family toxin of Txe-Axe toxin-antitoxin module
MIGAVSLDSSVLDKHPDVPKEYIKMKLLDSICTCDKYKLYRGDREPLDIKAKKCYSRRWWNSDREYAISKYRNAAKTASCENYRCRSSLTLRYCPHIWKQTDELIYLIASKHFSGVGSFSKIFSRRRRSNPNAGSHLPLHKCHTNHYSKNGHHEKLELDIPLTHVTLKGNLLIPEEAAVTLCSPMEVVAVGLAPETGWWLNWFKTKNRHLTIWFADSGGRQRLRKTDLTLIYWLADWLKLPNGLWIIMKRRAYP